MATQPLDTAKVYALTAAGACSVTLTQGEKSITWEALTEGGQTGFIVPAGATATLSDPTAIISPLPANFKAALGAGAMRIEGERIIAATDNEQHRCSVKVSHSTWCVIPSGVMACRLTPVEATGRAHSMQLLLAPDSDLSSGWLSSSAQLVWLYGEPSILSGHTYIIGLTQIAPDKILANLLATI